MSADVSSFGFSAALWQVQPDGRIAPVAYASRTLTDQERLFSQIEETLAIVWVCDRFECYLLVRDEPFVIETDHKPLVTILDKQDLEQGPPRIQRLKMQIIQYYIEVVYVPGKTLPVADVLSRHPLKVYVVDSIVDDWSKLWKSMWKELDMLCQHQRMVLRESGRQL